MTFRKIAEIVGYSHVSVYEWVMKLGDEVMNRFQLSDLKYIEHLELDELFTFKDSKKKEFTS